MKKCEAYYPIAGSRTAWIPCVRKAEPGSRFCRRHDEAITGALLGALVHEEPGDEVAVLREDVEFPPLQILRNLQGRGECKNPETEGRAKKTRHRESAANRNTAEAGNPAEARGY
jgi:hypothetical protein